MINLTQGNGCPLYVRPEFVVAVTETTEGKTIVVAGPDLWWEVEGPTTEVARKLGERTVEEPVRYSGEFFPLVVGQETANDLKAAGVDLERAGIEEGKSGHGGWIYDEKRRWWDANYQGTLASVTRMGDHWVAGFNGKGLDTFFLVLRYRSPYAAMHAVNDLAVRLGYGSKDVPPDEENS